jgi:hypothetical protein
LETTIFPPESHHFSSEEPPARIRVAHANVHNRILGGFGMAEFREILRLNSLGLSGRSIAGSVSCSRNTVAEVLARAKKIELEWPLPLDITDDELKKMLFPEKEKAAAVRVVITFFESRVSPY